MGALCWCYWLSVLEPRVRSRVRRRPAKSRLGLVHQLLLPRRVGAVRSALCHTAVCGIRRGISDVTRIMDRVLFVKRLSSRTQPHRFPGGPNTAINAHGRHAADSGHAPKLEERRGLRRSAFSVQFRNGQTAWQDQIRASGKIGDGDMPGINAEVSIDRGEEIAGRGGPFDDFFSMPIGGAEHAAGLNPAARPQLRKCTRPMIAAGLNGAGGGAGHSSTAAGHRLDAWRSSEFTRHND